MASFIKWIGTIIILAVGIILAYKFSSGADVSELKVYKVVLPSYEYHLSDTNKVYTSFEFLFYTEAQAKKLVNNSEIFEIIKRVILQFSAQDFSSTEGLLKVRAELFVRLNKTSYPVLAVKFYTNPKVY